MDDQAFQELATRVISREASAMESARLESTIARDAARRAEFEALKCATGVLSEALPLLQAMKAAGPALPEHRVNELKTALRGQLRTRRPETILLRSALERWRDWIFERKVFAGGLAAVALACVLIFVSTDQPRIEVGMYETAVMRGGNGDVRVVPARPGVQMVPFKTEEEFEKWRKAVLPGRVKARLWIDEESGTVHVRFRGDRGEVRESSEPLAASAKDQENQFTRLIQAVK